MLYTCPRPCSPEAQVARDAYRMAGRDIDRLIRLSLSGRELVDTGYSGDVDLALEQDTSSTVPILAEGGRYYKGALWSPSYLGVLRRRADHILKQYVEQQRDDVPPPRPKRRGFSFCKRGRSPQLKASSSKHGTRDGPSDTPRGPRLTHADVATRVHGTASTAVQLTRRRQ
jgi:hypothetical protein